MRVLVVEDEWALSNDIALSLKGEGTEIIQTPDLAAARQALQSPVDLIILDINLPDGSGLSFCKELRGSSDVPVIFLTANDMETDIVTGLECGGDDYITKPFSLMVLRARVNAVLRRRQGGRSQYEGDGFSFDFESMVFLDQGNPVEMSKTEQRLLRLLVLHRGRTLTREMLIDRIWSDGAQFVEENALSVTVKRLREKLPGAPIKTVYGIGYQ